MTLTPTERRLDLLADLLREHLTTAGDDDLLVLPLRAVHVLPGAFPWGEESASIDPLDLHVALAGSTTGAPPGPPSTRRAGASS